MLRRAKLALVCVFMLGISAALAQNAAPAPEPSASSDGQAKIDVCKRARSSDSPSTEPSARCLRYSWGLGIQASDIGGDGQRFRLRPSLGLEYGRFSLGVLSADDWLGYSGLRKQSSLSYRLSDDPNWRSRLSLSAVNVNSGEGLGSLEGGRYTLRARLAVGYQLSPRVQLGGDISHDLLGRGAGTALTLGATRNFPWGEKTMLSLSASTTVGNSDFWEGANTTQATQKISAGWGSVSAGLGMRHKLSDDWAVFGQVASGTPVGVVRDAGITRTTFSGRVGFIKFGIW